MPFCRGGGGGGAKIHPGHTTRPTDWSHVPRDPREFRSLLDADPLFPLALLHAGRPGFDRPGFWNLALETKDAHGSPGPRVADDVYDASTGCPDERVIDADVPRTPLHGTDATSCRDLLRAVARSNPRVGYTQGMSYIAVVFLNVAAEEVKGKGKGKSNSGTTAVKGKGNKKGGKKGEASASQAQAQAEGLRSGKGDEDATTVAERAFPLLMRALKGPIRGLHDADLHSIAPLSRRFEVLIRQVDAEIAGQLAACGCRAEILVPGWYIATFAQTFPSPEHVTRLWDHIVLVGVPALEAAGLAVCLARKKDLRRAAGSAGGGSAALGEIAMRLKSLDEKAMKRFWRVYPAQIEFVMAQPTLAMTGSAEDL